MPEVLLICRVVAIDLIPGHTTLFAPDLDRGLHSFSYTPFAEGGKGAEAFRFTREALQDSQNLRKVGWQKISEYMRKKGLLDWLTDILKDKYAIEWASTR